MLLLLLSGFLLLVTGQNSTCSSSSISLNATDISVPCSLQEFLANITTQEQFKRATWLIGARDYETSELIVDVNAEKISTTGSIMKTPTCATVLKLLGPDHRFVTTLNSSGSISNGTLDGDLVLVGAGDFSFGLRESVYKNGTMFSSDSPFIDHNYADTGLANIQAPPGDPYYGMKILARQLQDQNITTVTGNLYVDTSLFDEYVGPDGIISPIWFNENVIDINVTAPADTGSDVQISYNPQTPLWTVQSNVQVVSDAAEPLQVVANGTTITLSGNVTAGSNTTSYIFQIPDPAAWARSGMLQVLNEANITVQSANDTSATTQQTSGAAQSMVIANYTSAELAQFTSVVLRISYNRGAASLGCHIAVADGSKSCLAGIPTVVSNLLDWQVGTSDIYPFDFAGSDERDRGSPAGFTIMLENVRKTNTSWSEAFYDSLATLGRTGTDAQNQRNEPVAGKAQVKGGTRAGVTPAGQPLLTGLTLVGYLTCQSGREVTFTVMLRDYGFSQVDQVLILSETQGSIVNAIYEAF